MMFPRQIEIPLLTQDEISKVRRAMAFAMVSPPPAWTVLPLLSEYPWASEVGTWKPSCEDTIHQRGAKVKAPW